MSMQSKMRYRAKNATLRIVRTAVLFVSVVLGGGCADGVNYGYSGSRDEPLNAGPVSKTTRICVNVLPTIESKSRCSSNIYLYSDATAPAAAPKVAVPSTKEAKGNKGSQPIVKNGGEVEVPLTKEAVVKRCNGEVDATIRSWATANNFALGLAHTGALGTMLVFYTSKPMGQLSILYDIHIRPNEEVWAHYDVDARHPDSSRMEFELLKKLGVFELGGKLDGIIKQCGGRS